MSFKARGQAFIKKLYLGSTAVTATGTEVNTLAGVTAGTALANKAAVLGATKNLDTLVVGTLTVSTTATLPTGGVTNAALATPNSQVVLTTYIAGAQTTGTDKYEWLVPFTGTITDVRCYLTTAPTTSSFIADLMKNTVTLFTTTANRPTIAASANASSTTLPDIVSVAAGDRLRLDNIQIGSGTAGSGLIVSVSIKVALSA